MSERIKFYQDGVKRRITDKKARILVLGAWKLDYDVMSNLHLKNCTFSNIIPEDAASVFASSKYVRASGATLPFHDNEFEFVVEHAAIHHSSRPHSFITEMYRVAEKAVIIFENSDSLISKLAQWLGMSEEYEVSAVADTGWHSGGVDNTKIPNYVYRWTEREIYKLIASYDPICKPVIEYDYKCSIDNKCKTDNKPVFKLLSNIFTSYLLKTITFIFPKQSNLMSIYIDKQNSIKSKHSWIK